MLPCLRWLRFSRQMQAANQSFCFPLYIVTNLYFLMQKYQMSYFKLNRSDKEQFTFTVSSLLNILYQLFKVYNNQIIVKAIKFKSQNNVQLSTTTKVENIRVQKGFNQIFTTKALSTILKDLKQFGLLTQFTQNIKDEQIDMLQKNMQTDKNEEEMKKFERYEQFLQLLTNLCTQVEPLPIIEPQNNNNFTKIDLYMLHSCYFNKLTIDVLIQTQQIIYTLKEREQQKSTWKQDQSNMGFQGSYTIYLNHNRGQNLQIQIDLSKQLNQWQIGIFNQNHFVEYFSTGVGQKVAKQKYRQIRFKYFLYWNQGSKNFKIISFFYQGYALKLQFKLDQIHNFFIQPPNLFITFTNPPKIYISKVTTNQYIDPRFIINWQRTNNFFILKNKNLNNDLIRLLLINNFAIKMMNFNDQDNFLDYLRKAQFKGVQMKLQKKMDMINRKRVQQANFLFYSQESINSMFKQYDPKTQYHRFHINWKLKYTTLALFSKNIIPIQLLQDFVDAVSKLFQPKNQNLLLYTLQQLYTSSKPLQSIHQFTRLFQSNQKKRAIIQSKIIDHKYIVYIYRITLTPSGFRFGIRMPQLSNRVHRRFKDYQDQLIRCTVLQENGLSILGDKKYLTHTFFKGILKEIKLFDKRFEVLGWSPSQLRGYSLWFISKQNPGFHKNIILNFLGDFDLKNEIPQKQKAILKLKKIKNAAKKAARIGQAFSSSFQYNISNMELQVKYQSDIQTNDKPPLCFSDGIGKISKNLIKNIELAFKLNDLCAIQVRYMGAKGILSIDQTLKDNVIILRKSMVKYYCNDIYAKSHIDILDYNKYRKGLINRQIILLLSTLGIKNQDLIQLQEKYLKTIEQLSYKNGSIFNFISMEIQKQMSILQPMDNMLRRLFNKGWQLDKQPFMYGLLTSMKRKGYQKLIQKSNFDIQKAVRLVGIIDQYKLLKQGEIFCQFKNPFHQMEKINVVGKVVLTRNPCLHPGDIRVVKAVSNQQILIRMNQQMITLPKVKRYKDRLGKQNHPFHAYLNTIIFPQVGEVPLTHQISGSDLDGDMFFLSWDPKLIPQSHVEPMNYNAMKSRQVEVTDQLMLDFFVDYLNYDILGKVDNTHLVVSDKDLINLASNKKSLQLAQIHGQAVDFPKTGVCPAFDSTMIPKKYPDFMEKSPSYISQSVLGILYREAKDKSMAILQKLANENVVQMKNNFEFWQVQEFNYDKSQLETFVDVYFMYQNDVRLILNMHDIVSEFDLYTGNFKNKQNINGEKLMNQLLKLKTSYQNIFKKSEGENLPSKAYLWYTGVNVIVYGFEDKHGIKKEMQDMVSGREGKMLGLGWFIIGEYIEQFRSMSLREESKSSQQDHYL